MTKEELSSIYYIRQEIKMWEEQLELLTCKAQGKAMRLTGMPFGPSSGTGDQMADIAVRKADITELIERKKERLQQKQKKIIEWIMTIDDTFIRQIMLYRHVRCYTWQEVADQIGHTTAESVRKQHDRYLQQAKIKEDICILWRNKHRRNTRMHV